MNVTPKQAELLSVIKDFQELNGYTPSIKELGELTNKSYTAVRCMLVQLEGRGRIRRVPGATRSLEIL
ncbi:MAG: hypothetical protein VYD03_05650 [Pseudomonadota bacterium]|nr:hypothetical protein [Pseudomonadota bacterium]